MNTGRFALTGVALAAACLLSTPAWSLGLGRLAVQSALGEPLRAEIDVTSITPEEASTLQLRIADADVFRAAGVEYSPVLPGAQVQLQRRADGRSVVRLSSSRAVTEPFLDVILEANWAAGRLVRAYTMLLDPPITRQAAAPAPAAPSMSPTPGAVTTPVRPAPPAPAAAPAPAARPPVAAAPAPAPATRPAAAAPAPRPAAAPAPSPAPADRGGDDRYRVKAGDTLSKIAGRVTPAGVSLDQMLVALFRANPDAFMGENMNRLKAGAVLDLPKSGEAGQVDAAEARRVIVAQSADFDAYRQRLASGVGTTARETADRRAKGTVQASVEDRRSSAAQSPDKLKLSQASPTASAAESKVSRESESKEAAARVAELARNVEELKRLQSGIASASGPAATTAAPAPAPASGPAVVAALPTPAVASAPAPSPAPAPAASAPAPAPAPAVAKPAPKPMPKPIPTESPGFIASLLENPLVLPGAGVLVALLVGLGVYRLRGRMRKASNETSFLESRLQPDSFFGASGGQRIDTREAAPSSQSSSMSYSLSQLDAIGDVDPVAEADVYLAYGRDLQAEEILKEAMRATPERQAIRLKLLEVYAKRRDTKGLELLATQVYSMTKGEGEDWLKAQEIGRTVDPENPLYQPGGQPAAVMMNDGEIVEPLGATTMPHSVKPSSASTQDSVSVQPVDLGLDLDLDLESPSQPGDLPAGPAEVTQPLAPTARAPADDGLSFEIPDELPARPAPAAAPAADLDTLDFDLGDMSDVGGRGSDVGGRLPDEPRPAFSASVSPDDGEQSDFGSLTGDPLERKLELAEEFRQIGDVEGARDLLEEVLAKADGAVKAKAQSMLDRLA